MQILEELNKKQQDAVMNEVYYTKEQLEADLTLIKEWLEKQHHLPTSRLKESDCFLKFFLTGCKGSLEKVKKKLDAYYTYRSHSEIYECRDPLATEYVASIKLLIDSLSVQNVVVMDAEGFNASHVVKLKPIIIRDIIRIAQDILPLRYSAICVINVASVLEIAFNNLVIPFLSKKIKERFHLTSCGFEEVYKYVDKNFLPEDYNGDQPSVRDTTELWYKKSLEKRDWFLNELSERCDESKRIVQNDIMTNPYFGVHGSLKKLVID